MTKVRAIFEGREVLGTHTDRGLVSLYDNQGRKRWAYKSTVIFPGREIDSYVSKELIDGSDCGALIRHSEVEACLERYGYTGLVAVQSLLTPPINIHSLPEDLENWS